MRDILPTTREKPCPVIPPGRAVSGFSLFSAVATLIEVLIALSPALHTLLAVVLVALGYLLGVAVVLLGGLILLQAPVFYLMFRLAGMPLGGGDWQGRQEPCPPRAWEENRK